MYVSPCCVRRALETVMSLTCFTSNAELRGAVVAYVGGVANATYGLDISEWCVDSISDFSYIFADLTDFNTALAWNTSNALT